MPRDPQFIFDVMSGKRNPLLRAALSFAEPFYAGATLTRNFLYNHNLKKSHKLSVPVISVGNITTGGTGKTPTVRWLAEQLLARKLKPAILMRGYGNDEHVMLQQQLPSISIVANPDRVAGAKSVQADGYILDDGFQHRRVARDFDLVLINARNPFGFDHVLPRGLLREPISGLSRASAFLITHASESNELSRIEGTIRRYSSAPIYRCDHEVILPEELRQKKFFAFAGIGDPQSLERLLQSPNFVGHRWLGDHAQYDPQLLQSIEDEARRVGAEIMVTTEKDLPKLKAIKISTPIVAAGVRLKFHEDHAEKLCYEIFASIHSHKV